MNRIACGWAKFTQYRREMTDWKNSMEKRQKLFNATVTPTVLYGSCSWTMTKERENMLKVAQRRMLRKIVQVPRWVDEELTSYIVRSTYAAENLSMKVGVPSWIQEQRRRKWRWGGHIARLTDRRWTQLALHWIPDGRRQVGRPRMRWDDAFVDFFQKVLDDRSANPWYRHAASRSDWKSLEDAFVRSV